MSNEIVDVRSEGYRAMIEVVRKSIFPNSSDAEMALFVHKCKSVGVSPMDQRIIPMKFNSMEGPKVSFITTIDLFRSKADESGEYDGQDEPEFEGIIVQESESGNIDVPETCKVKVYRKNMSRPIVGIAHWKEYYPGEKKGHQWRKRPHGMLAKCAEAQALRKAFPQKLDKLYSEEEMMQATESISGVRSDDPRYGMPAPIERQYEPSPAEEQPIDRPDDATRKANKWISEAQERRLHSICTSKKVDHQAVKQYIRIMHKDPNAQLFNISWAKANGKDSEYDRICKTIEEKPDFFAKYAPVHQTQGNSPATQNNVQAAQVTDAQPTPGIGGMLNAREAFEINLRTITQGIGITDDQVNAELDRLGHASINDVPESEFSAILQHFGQMAG